MRRGVSEPETLTYHAVIDGETALALLRRVPGPDGLPVAEVWRRDGRWYPTDRFGTHARNGEYDIEEIPADRAAALVERWRR